MAMSVVVSYAVSLLLIPLTVWWLFIWQRPDDPGGVIMWDALHSGFWTAIGWLMLVGAAIVVLVPIARAIWRRVAPDA